MRFIFGSVLFALVWISPALLESGGAPAFPGVGAPTAEALIHQAKIVCGDFGEGFTCRRKSGAIRRGKMPPVPGSNSDNSGDGLFGGGSDDPDALPPPPGETSSGTTAPSTTPTTCPANSELLGGHCIPYTQTCRKGLAANAAPQVCRNAEEKLICNFRSDGLKDCCCRTYSKF